MAALRARSIRRSLAVLKTALETFYGGDAFKGEPIRVRFFWTEVTSRTPHWEQAFSIDGGKTWETNWTMDFTKLLLSAGNTRPQPDP
jgi:hypothetical protein